MNSRRNGGIGETVCAAFILLLCSAGLKAVEFAGDIRFSFAAEAPYGSGWVGGLASRITNRSVGEGDVIDLTPTEMQTASPFVAAGWDLGNVWTICEGRDYPRLRWEDVQCEGGL